MSKALDRLAVRCARAEIERDAALERAERAENMFHAVLSKDKEAMLDTLHIIGIPARDLADIYRLEERWLNNGGSDRLLADIREQEAFEEHVGSCRCSACKQKESA